MRLHDFYSVLTPLETEIAHNHLSAFDIQTLSVEQIINRLTDVLYEFAVLQRVVSKLEGAVAHGRPAAVSNS